MIPVNLSPTLMVNFISFVVAELVYFSESKLIKKWTENQAFVGSVVQVEIPLNGTETVFK